MTMPSTARLLAALALLVAVLVVAPTRGTDARPAAQSPSFTPALRLVAGGFVQPLFVAHAGDGSGRLFVVERGGTIRVVEGGRVLPSHFLDIRALLRSSASEQGLLGLAFHPSFASNGRFFVYYTAADADNTLARYRVSATDRNRADPASATVLFAIPDRFSNHNGGMLAFGPDRFLYVGTGDGGSAGDPDNNAQNLRSLLGKLLRLDVDGGDPYAIPSSNPYAGRTDGTRREIWASGLRNPWRFGFDRGTGDLFIADVGQGSREEVDRQPAGSAGGQNYGWRIMEGSACYNPSSGCDRTGLTLPIYEYGHDQGDCSVTGGYVYRGAAMPALRGAYIFGDYCSGRVWALRLQSGEWVRTQLLDTSYFISSFGEDEAGELYLTDLAGGGVYKFVDPAAPTPTPQPTGTPAATATSPPSATPTSTPTSGARADLAITSFSASPTTSDRSIPLTLTIHNRGTASTGPGDSFDIHVFADLGRPPTPADSTYVGHIEVPTLGAGASRTVTGQVAAGALTPGDHTLWALADGHGVVAESDEGNNTRSVLVTVGAPSSASYRDTVLADGPIAYWRLGEAPGAATMRDERGLRPGTYVGGPALGSGGAIADDPQTAVRFNGSSQYATVPDAGGLSPQSWVQGTMSLEAWVKPSTLPTTGPGVIVSKGAARNYEYALRVYPNGAAELVLWAPGGATYQSVSTAPGAVTAGVWHHVVGTCRNGVSCRLYVNGAERGRVDAGWGATRPGDTSSPVQIARRGDGIQYLAATIDEVAVYGTVLSAAQVQAHFAAGR